MIPKYVIRRCVGRRDFDDDDDDDDIIEDDDDDDEDPFPLVPPPLQ